MVHAARRLYQHGVLRWLLKILCLAMFATEGGQAVWPEIKKASWGRDASEHFEKRLLESGADSPKLYDLLPYL